MATFLQRNAALWLQALLLTTVYVLFYTDAFFSHLQEADATMYLGLGYEYLNPAVGDGYYKVSRWAWVFLQFLRMKLFGGYVGAYVLHGGLLFLSHYTLLKFAEFMGAHRLLSFLFAAAGGYLLLWYGYEADYHGYFQSVLFLGGLLHFLLSRGKRSRTPIQTVFFLLGIFITPLFGWYLWVTFCLYCGEQWEKQSETTIPALVRESLFSLLKPGFLLTIFVTTALLLGLIHWIHSGVAGRQFFLKQLFIHLKERFLSKKALVDDADLFHLKRFLASRYTVYYIAVACFALLASLVNRLRKKGNALQSAATVQFLLLFGSSLVLHFVLRQEVYLREYMSALIFCSSLLLLGAFLRGTTQGSFSMVGFLVCAGLLTAVFKMPNTSYLRTTTPVWNFNQKRWETEVMSSMLRFLSPYRGKNYRSLLLFPDIFTKPNSIPQDYARNIRNGLHLQALHKVWTVRYRSLNALPDLMKKHRRQFLYYLGIQPEFHLVFLSHRKKRLDMMMNKVSDFPRTYLYKLASAQYLLRDHADPKKKQWLYLEVVRVVCSYPFCKNANWPPPKRTDTKVR